MTINLPTRRDIVLGNTLPFSTPFTQVRLGEEAQRYHGIIWGATGNGKTRLLQSVFLQHVNKANTVGLIEPHHDLSLDSLTYLASHGFFRSPQAYHKLVYLDWGAGCVPFNVLAGDGDPYTRANNALDAMLRVWPELKDAPLFQTLFLSSVMALIGCKLPITFLYQFLNDSAFRATCLAGIADPLIHSTFASFDKLRPSDQAQAAGSTLRRAFLLSFSPHARLTLGQPENWLDFRRFMDEGISFIINLGSIDDAETRKLIGAMLMVQLEQAALSRKDTPPPLRRPITVLCDEWPSFAAQDETLGTILSQTRKYNLRLYLAAQSLAQVSSQRLSGALENCKLSIVFGLGHDSAAIEAKHVGQIDVSAIKEAALTDTQHNIYQSVLEQYEVWTQELAGLDPQVAYVKLHNRPAVKMKTLTVPDVQVPPQELATILATYRQIYQRTQQEAEAVIADIRLPAPPPAAASAAPAYTTLFQKGKGKAKATT